MIPKIIHYCWFGGNPLPPLALKCIESWKKYLPDYEIKEWNETNFDVNMIPYTSEAYRLKKYAFVSDYARFYVLYKYGGLYFDTDVEVIKNMDDIIARGPFMGMEAGETEEALMINPGLGLGIYANSALYREVLEIYKQKHFTTWSGIMEDTVVTIVTRLLNVYPRNIIANGVFKCEELYLYSPDYFCPKNYYTGELKITNKSVCIHHYCASWMREEKSFFEKIQKRLLFVKARLLSSFL